MYHFRMMLKNNDGRVLGRPPKKADQKNRILLEAAKAITSVGYEQCNLQDIASAINLSRPALYYYFSTKQEIFTAIALKSMRGIYQFVSSEVEQEKSALKKLERFFLAHAQYFEENFWMVSATIVGYGGVARRDISDREAFEMFRKKYLDTLKQILEEGVDEGCFKVKDIALASRSIFQLLNISYWYKPDGKKDAVTIAKVNFKLLISGLA